VATEILDAAADADNADRRARLRAQAAAAGMLSQVASHRVSAERRQLILASMRGTGPVVDRLIDEDRGRV
jgi:hypothetical protein